MAYRTIIVKSIFSSSFRGAALWHPYDGGRLHYSVRYKDMANLSEMLRSVFKHSDTNRKMFEKWEEGILRKSCVGEECETGRGDV